jgi:hypothetical protein
MHDTFLARDAFGPDHSANIRGDVPKLAIALRDQLTIDLP